MKIKQTSFVSVMISSITLYANQAHANAFVDSAIFQIPLQTRAEQVAGFSTRAFNDFILNTLKRDLMGYAVILQDKTGKRIAEINYGYARRPGESRGVQPFTRDTVVTWGSITKMITAAAAIDRTEQLPRLNLDMRMVDYLPALWQVSNPWKPVTLRQLLSYQGGFNGGIFPPTNAKGSLRIRLERPQVEGVIGNRLYENANYSAFHFLGKFFVASRVWQAIEDGYPGGEVSYDEYIFAKTRPIWMNFLQTRIFGPLGIKGACGKIDFNGNNYALYYNGPGSRRGYFVNPEDMNNCASGGMVMSVRDMGVFIHALTQTDKIINRANYASTFGLINNNNVVGWNRSNSITGGRAFEKAGDHGASGSAIQGNSASGRVENYVMTFPNGMTAILAANSGIPDNATYNRSNMLRSAYLAGLAGAS